MKQTLKIAAMLLVVATLAMTGVALAQSDDDAPATTAATEDRPLYSRLLEWLAPLVDEGTISQSQAEAVAGTLAEAMPAGMRRMHRGLEAIAESADFLGLTPQEIVQALRDGDTLAEIAADAGSSGEALIDHLVGVVEEHLDQAVADGRITEERKEQMLENATDRITDLVNGDLERPFAGHPGGPMGGPGRGHMGGGMFGGPGGEGFGFEDPGA